MSWFSQSDLDKGSNRKKRRNDVFNGKICFIRHGNAAAATEDQHDRERPLSALGRQQAAERQTWLGHVSFDHVFSSPARRAIDTVSIVTGRGEADIIIVPALYSTAEDGAIGVALDAMFREVGYASLQEYAQHPSAGAIAAYGAKTWGLLLSEIQKVSGPPTSAKHIAVGGHALLIPAIAMTATFTNDELMRDVTQINLGEAEGIALKFVDGAVVDAYHIA